MNVRNKLLQIQKGVKRQRIQIEEDDSDEELNVDQIEENNENEEPARGEGLIQFENGTNQKLGLCLWNEGYRFLRKMGPYWRCSNTDCNATAKIIEEHEGIKYGTITKQHNHAPEPPRKEAENRRANAKKRFRAEPGKKQSEILTEARSGASLEVIQHVGNNRAFNKMLSREKGKFFGNVNSRDLLAIELPQELIMMDGNDICLYDSRDTRPNEKDVVFVFAHQQLLDILKKKRNKNGIKWACDGTFKVAPRPWVQCFVVGAFINASQTIPCVYALLPGKQSKYYAEALQAIKAAIYPTFPLKIISDFEQGIIKATARVFPTTSSKGCLFHFGQSIYRKWCNLKLRPLFKHPQIGDQCRNTFRQILALALIDPEYVRRTFGLIIDQSPMELKNFLMYFAETYIGFTEVELQIGANAFEGRIQIQQRRSSTISQASRPGQNNSFDEHDQSGNVTFGRPSPRPSTLTLSATTAEETIDLQRWELEIVKEPKYKIDFWNVHDEAMLTLAKTNNSMEANHNQFQRKLTHHPALSDFLRAFREDVDKQLTKDAAAKVFPPSNNRYFIRADEIMHALITAEYEEDDDLLDLVTLLGIKMQGYVAGMRAPANANQEDANRTEDTIDLEAEADIFDDEGGLDFDDEGGLDFDDEEELEFDDEESQEIQSEIDYTIPTTSNQ